MSLRMRPVACLSVCLVLVVSVSGANVFEEEMFTPLESKGCYRLYTATRGPVGCAAMDREGVSGLLYKPSSMDDLDELLDDPKVSPRALLLSTFDVSQVGKDRWAKMSPNVAGVIVTSDDSGDRTGQFSPASKRDGTKADHSWNAFGLDLLQSAIDVPMTLVNSTTSKLLLGKAAENEASKFKAPSHAIRFRYYMGPEGLDSQTCLDNGQCLPVGGQSVWGHIGELEAVDDGGKPVVMLVAAMDSNALFHEAAVGAASAASDIVTVIAAVDALKRAGVESLPLTVAFGLFQGESFGRVGSRRWLDEVEDFACPAANVQPASKSSTGKDFCRGPLRTDLSFTKLSMASFAHVVGVDQSGSPGEEFYVHQPSGTGDSTLLDVVQMTALHSRQPATWPVGDHGLPPTAVDTFLQHNLSLSTAVLSKYASSYSDRYYHSHLDDQHNVNTDDVVEFATSVARSIYALATGLPAGDAAAKVAAQQAALTVDATLVETALDCFVKNASCPFFADVIGVSSSDLEGLTGGGSLSLYTSVYNEPYNLGTGFYLSPTVAERFARQLLAKVSGDAIARCDSDTACKSLDRRLECAVGVCVNSTVHYHDALSPALWATSTFNKFEVRADKIVGENAEPLYTEPYWSSNVGVSLFLEGGDGSAWLVLLGLSVTCVAYYLSLRFEQYARKTFKIA